MDTLPIYRLAVQPRHGELVTTLPRDEVRSGERAWVVRMVGDFPAFDIMRWKAEYLSDRGHGGMGYIDIRNPVCTWRDVIADLRNRCLVPNTTDQWQEGMYGTPAFRFCLTRELETSTPGVWWREGGEAYLAMLATCQSIEAPVRPVLLRGETAHAWLTANAYDAVRSLPVKIDDVERWTPERLQMARDEEAQQLCDDTLPF